MEAERNTQAPLDQKLARVAVRPLARTRITPNMITLAGMVLGLVAAVMFASGEAATLNWAAAIFVVAAWIDHADGEHARATDQTSTFGHYFDHVGAMTTYISMFVGAGIGLRNSWLGEWSVPLGIAAGIAVAAIFSVRMWVEAQKGKQATEQTVRMGFQVEDTLYVVAPLTWLGVLAPFVAAAGIGAPLFLLWVVWQAMNSEKQRAPGPEGL